MRVAFLFFLWIANCACADGGWQDFWHDNCHRIQTMDSRGNFIMLEDGSIWETEKNSWNCSQRWKTGERVRIDCVGNCGNFRFLSSDLSFVHARPCRVRHHEKHRHFISEISGTVVRLSSGLCWQIDDECIEELSCWKVGDEVCLHVEQDLWKGRRKVPCCLRNLCTLSGVRAHLKRQHECLKSPLITCIDGNQIILNDGTLWELSNPWDFVQIWGWKPGDRAFIFSDLGACGTFTFMNFDAHHHNFACIRVFSQNKVRCDSAFQECNFVPSDRFRIQENLNFER